MDLEYFCLTDVGCVRANNEDAVLVDAAHGLAVLADGMGGYNAGEVASAMAVEQVARELAAWLEAHGASAPAHDRCRAMEVAADNANRAIFEAAHVQPDYAGMGTTLVLALLQGQQLLLGHAGDSRAYRWRQGELQQLTRDHSLLQEQLDAGLITPAEAAVSGYRSLVTRALGVEDTVLLDTRVLDWRAGDRLLLCSDGLTDMLEDADIARILAQDGPLEAPARRLVEQAKANGGRDNISVILMRTEEMIKKSGSAGKWWKK